MFLTKPAGVFLQLLSIVFFLWAIGAQSWWVAMVGAALLILGGIPANQDRKR